MDRLDLGSAGNINLNAGAGAVVVPDGCRVGATAACSWVFDSSNGDVTTLDDVGIGIAAPLHALHIQRAFAGDLTAFVENTSNTQRALVLAKATGGPSVGFYSYGGAHATDAGRGMIYCGAGGTSLDVVTGQDIPIIFIQAGNERVRIGAPGGSVTLSSLAGAGVRAVVAAADGTLSAP